VEEFPFSDEEWDEVCEATRLVCNATLIDDQALHQSYLVDLQEHLQTLQITYGRHPILLETEADFLDDPDERVVLYEEAIRIATENELPTYTIRISLAQLLLDSLNDVDGAGGHLASCASEVQARGDEHEKAQWSQLQSRCNLPS
jgi:hypothetical protein